MDELEIDYQALIETFVTEATETLDAMEQRLVALETRPGDVELVHALFRDAHTLKGSASVVAFDAVRDLSHEAEALLDRVRARTLAVTPERVTLLLRTVDLLRSALGDAADGRTHVTPELERFRLEIQRAVADGTAAEPAPAAPVVEASAPARSARSLRVDVAKLDRMLNVSGEIAIARGRLTDMLERRTSLTIDEILEAHREADRLYLDLQELVMKARMVPVGPLFQQQLRAVRDLARAQGKQVQLTVEGAEVELDTSIVEHLRDPLTHMIRNAVDHGIEKPEVRAGRGKSPTGRLALRAFHDGGSIVVQVEDDGNGLDRTRIAAKAKALGLAPEPGDALLRLVFEPGFSTRERVTDVSGRGVGLDVVRRNVEALHGSVSVESAEGRGTTLTLRLPLTLAIVQGFRVGVGAETYILPLDSVVECLELPAGVGEPGEVTGVLGLRGQPLPFLRLRNHLGVPGDAPGREAVVVVRHGGATAGIAVDHLFGESQTVVKPLGRMFQGLPGIAGSSILGDGTVALILDVGGLLREALRRAQA
jgi:two-component system chemotaxis sensor kinase CheA